MDREEYELRQEKWHARVCRELDKAPPEFQQAFQVFCDGNVPMAEKLLSQCALRGIWTGTSSCIVAYICKERGEYDQAIMFAKAEKKFGIEFPGYWYYYDAMIISLNQTDQLLECLNIIEEAIEFFSREDSPTDLANYYSLKSNILKQMAAPYSHSIENLSQVRAKELIIEAIRSICQSMVIISEGWEQDIKEELKGLKRIAARVGITRSDLSFLEEMHEIRAITDIFFENRSLTMESVSQCFNEAQEKWQKGNRQEADLWFKRTIQIAPEDTPNDRAFKALVAYQAGVNLLRIHNLDDNRPDNIEDRRTLEAIEQIRSLWKTSLRLYDSLSPQDISDFDKKFPPGLTDAVWNIKRDVYIMSDIWIK
jgi:tetratricopeptide (TPR) repeat protein